MTDVTAVAVPPQSGVAGHFKVTHFADAYEVSLPDGSTGSPERLARFVFEHQPAWIGGLMRVRDALVTPLGLKTSADLAPVQADRSASRVGIFRIYSRSATEIILGEDDSHLDFRLSVMRLDSGLSPGDTRLVVATVVHCHNRLGRAYIACIAPFHRLVVRACLKRAARLGWPT